MISGEPWILRDRDVTPIICCDCGLVHHLLVGVKGKKVTLRFYRDSHATKQGRKKDRIIVYRKETKNTPQEE